MKMAWLQLFGLVLFSAHVYGRSQLVDTHSLLPDIPLIWGWLGSVKDIKIKCQPPICLDCRARNRPQLLIKMTSNLCRSISIPYKCPRKTHFNTQCPVGGRGSDRRQRWYVNCLTLMSNRQMMATYHQIEIRWMALMADGVTNIC